MWNIKDYELERNLSQVCKIKTLSEKKTTKKEKEKQFLKSDKILGLDLDTRTGGRMKALQKCYCRHDTLELPMIAII